MKLLAAMQIGWETIVLVFFGFQFFSNRDAFSGLIVAVFLAYLFASVVLIERQRWAWVFSFLPPTGSLVLYGPLVGYNLWRASQHDQLFSDSPGTLIVVVLSALVFVVPPIMLLVRLVIVRSQLLPNQTIEPTR